MSPPPPLPPAPYGVKDRVGHWLLRTANIDRIHIVGCSRSGTTMLQFAMIAFEGTIIANGESSVWWPGLSGRAALFLRYGFRPGPRHLITKRNRYWYAPAEVAKLIEHTRRKKIGIINVIRDPRDVLSSRHARHSSDEPYVTLDHWRESIAAGETIIEALDGYDRLVTLRYEDVVQVPAQVQTRLSQVFGLSRRPGVESISHLRSNIENADYAISDEMRDAMHGLRDMEADAVQRWKKSHPGERFTVPDPEVQRRIEAFMTRHRYA